MPEVLDPFREELVAAVEKVLEIWAIEQDHDKKSPYRFQRTMGSRGLLQSWDSLPRKGLGVRCATTGMLWSGFRPSDDRCRYPYLIPSEMFAVVVLKEIEEMFEESEDICQKARSLFQAIQAGIQQYAIVKKHKFGQVYAFEVDGRGHRRLMDDANVPSLLSAPYLGYCDKHDEIYQNTRHLILSRTNPYYFEGKFAKGIGSLHNFPPKNKIWHIALAIQGLTSDTKDEKLALLKMMANTDADKGYMHESFNVNDPSKFTRSWFSWANMMYCQLVMDYLEIL